MISTSSKFGKGEKCDGAEAIEEVHSDTPSPPLNLRRDSSLGSTARETNLIARHTGGPLDSSLQRSSKRRCETAIQSQGSLMSSILCWKNVYLLSRIIVHPSHLSPRVSKRTFIYLLFYLFSFYIYLISRIIVDRRILYLRDTFRFDSSVFFLRLRSTCPLFSFILAQY